MFHPVLVKEQGDLPESEVRRLLVFVPRLNKATTIAALSMRAAYLAECLATPAQVWQQADVEAIWQEARFQRVGSWHLAAKVVMLAQPSSAPIERVFSMLQTVVADQQGNLLQDYQSLPGRCYDDVLQ